MSILLPTYNRKSLLKRSISSVLAQTYDNWELIIIDDGSTDGTEEYIKSTFVDNRIKYFRQANKGVSSARNTGGALATGKVIAFIDSDDEWCVTKLARQLEFMDVHPDAGLIFSNATIIGPAGEASDKPELIPHRKDMVYGLKEVLADPYLGIPTVIMTNDLFAEVGGFDERLSTAEDVDFFLRVALKSRIGYLHEKLVFVYKTTHSLSSFALDNGNKIASFEDNIFVLQRFVERYRKDIEKCKCDVNRLVFNLYMSYSRALLANGNPKVASEKIGTAHKYEITAESLYLLAKSLIVNFMGSVRKGL